MIIEKAFYLLKEDFNWRTKYLILNSPSIIKLENNSLFFYYEIFENNFKSKEQEIQTSTVRALTILLSQIESIEKMQEFWSVFENFIKTELMPSQNFYVKKNFLRFLETLLKKGKIADKYAIESFIMYLDFFTYQDLFNEVKISSMNYLEIFFDQMQNKF